jgi:hypothetical protein
MCTIAEKCHIVGAERVSTMPDKANLPAIAGAPQESPLPLGKALLVLVVISGPIVGAALIALVRVIAIISS